MLIQVLSAFSDPNDGRIIVLTDGEENGSPAVRDVHNQVCSNVRDFYFILLRQFNYQ